MTRAGPWPRALLVFGLPVIFFAVAVGVSMAQGTGAAKGRPPPALSVSIKSVPPPPVDAQPTAPSPTVEPPANRADCRLIRGTAYESDAERDWFIANCSNSVTPGSEPVVRSRLPAPAFRFAAVLPPFVESAAQAATRGGRAATAAPALAPPSAEAAPDDTIYGTYDRFVIKRLGVDAPVNVRMVGPDGVLGNPIGGKDVVLYDFSPLGSPSYGGYPGLGGNTVIAGHVDYICCLAVFAALRSIQDGDLIDYMTWDGLDIQYSVQWVYDYPDDTDWNPFMQVHGTDEVMTLMTCNGTFDQATHNYDRRRVVRAIRVQ